MGQKILILLPKFLKKCTLVNNFPEEYNNSKLVNIWLS